MQILSRAYFADKSCARPWSLKSLYEDKDARACGVISRASPWLHVGDPAAWMRAERFMRYGRQR